MRQRGGAPQLPSGVCGSANTLERRQRVLFPADDDWQEAWRRFAADGIGGPGIVDHLAFLVMRRHGLAEVFTNERHFRTAGFEPLF